MIAHVQDENATGLRVDSIADAAQTFFAIGLQLRFASAFVAGVWPAAIVGTVVGGHLLGDCECSAKVVAATKIASEELQMEQR